MVRLCTVISVPPCHLLYGTRISVCVSFLEVDVDESLRYVTGHLVTANMRLLWYYVHVPDMYLRPTDYSV